jgi:hypothetical protein
MKRLWTIIGVRDVPRSFRWYQALLGLAPGAPAHPDFGQLLDADGTVLLCLRGPLPGDRGGEMRDARGVVKGTRILPARCPNGGSD